MLTPELKKAFKNVMEALDDIGCLGDAQDDLLILARVGFKLSEEEIRENFHELLADEEVHEDEA